MNMMKKEVLIDLVKAAGQEVIDRAADFVNDGIEPNEMDIWIRFRPDEPVEIECSSSYHSMNSYRVLTDRFINGA